MSEEEWEDFQVPQVLSPDISGKLWDSITRNTTIPAVQYSHFRWMAAASAVLVIGLSWYLISKEQKTTVTRVAAVARTAHILNKTPQKRTLTLGDGSMVELSPNSTLSYPGNINSVKREVILNGEANFSIAKDVEKPFSLHINSVLITVLGTRFAVSSYDSNTVTKVILNEGRIMVTITDPSSPENKNEYYLSPGDVFIFKKTARVLHLEKDKDDRYIFDNYPLDVVFDQLQLIYNTKVMYDRAELGNRSFIGKIDPKDPLYHILQSISLLNHFGLRKQGDSYIIGHSSQAY